MKRILTAAALAAAALGANAQVTATGTTGIVFTGPWDPTVQVAGLPSFTAGLLNSPVLTTAGTLTATFLGKEALDTDTYTFTTAIGGPLFNTGAVGATISGPVVAGSLPIVFADLTHPNPGFSSYAVLGTFSGANATGTFTPSHFGGFDLLVSFNDGLAVDGDYDDMVVGLKVSAVPEPETYALLIAGIGAVGFITRRRRRSLSA